MPTVLAQENQVDTARDSKVKGQRSGCLGRVWKLTHKGTVRNDLIQEH